ncbi:MAG TPA: ABC transporter permease [Candidatus Nanopelagicales bacterium]|nr:ABC transporter permease [Candidatus Nanopelagicales bacterium]
MSTATVALAHSTTMTRRSIRRLVRYPSMTVLLVGMPVVFLLLFVFVFGQTLGAGLGFGDAGRTAYAGYITPGVLVITIAAAAQGTAISVALDMASGLIARFRTMPVTRSAVLTGHAVTSFVQTFGSLLLVALVALLVGFRPSAGVGGWLGALAILALFTLALTWFSVAIGLWAKTPESASNIPMFLILLPFLSSGFVPTESLPTALRWFAEYEPFTPVIESVRGLLLGGAQAHYVVLAVVWSLAITAASFLWAQRLFDRRPSR